MRAPCLSTVDRTGILRVLLSAVALTAIGCEIPEAPSWDVDLNVPITDRVDTLADLVDDEQNLGIGADGTVELQVREAIDRVVIDGEVTLSPFSESDTFEVGAIELDAPAPVSEAYRFGDLWAPAELADGQTVTVPPFAFDVVDGPIVLDSFQSATLETAVGWLDVTNGLPVPVGPATIDISNEGSGAVVGTVTLVTPIAPGATVRYPIDFAGQTVESSLMTRIAGQAQGSGGDVTVDAEATVSIALEILPPLTATQATTIVRPQTISHNSSLAIGEDSQSGQITFDSGLIELDMTNHTELNVQVTVTLPEFGGAASSVGETQSLLPQSAGAIEVDLVGETWNPETAGEVQYDVTMVVWSDDPVTVSSADQMGAFVHMDEEAQIGAFAGVLEPTELAIPTTTSEVDIPDGLDQVSFSHASLRLALTNSVEFPVDLDGTLLGRVDGGAFATVQVTGRLAAATGSGPTETVIVLDETNSNLVDLMNLTPSTFEFEGIAMVGDGTTSGRVARGDFIEGTVVLAAPLIVELAADRVAVDPEELTLSSDTRDAIRDDIRSGEITALIDNGFPTGATLHLVVSRTLAGAENPDLPGNLVLTGSVPAPELAVDGTAVGSASTTLHFQLDEADLDMFETGPTYTGVVLDLPGSGGQEVRFLSDDAIAVRALATFRTRVELD